MYKRCVTEQSAKRQRELENGLMAAMLAHPYEEITVSDLCDSMNIPRKSFYRYFSSKEGALYALIDHTMTDFAGEFFSIEFSDTLNTLERLFSFWKGQSKLLDVLAVNNLSGLLYHRGVIRATEDNLVAKQLFRHRESYAKEYVTTFLISGLISMIIQWHSKGFKESPRQLANIAAHMLTMNIIDSL